MSWRDWFRRNPGPSTASKQAHTDADESLFQARLDLERGNKKLLESRIIALRIKDHNVANHYDDWLSEQFLKYYDKP